MKNRFGFSPFTIVLLLICVGASLIMNNQRNTRAQYEEAADLPFIQFEMSQVEDGTYNATTVTSFIHVTLEVTVKDHKIQNIQIIENYGSKGKHVEPIIQSMIENNSSVVQAINGEELASMAFISCANTAIKKGVPELNE